MPAAVTAFNATAQVVKVPSPSAAGVLFSPSPSPSQAAQSQGAFTVLLLGSDDDSKFFADHVLTQSMILVRVVPATKEVTMLSIPRDLYAHLSTGGFGKIDGAYSYGGAGAAIATVQQDFNVHIDDYIWVGLLGLIKVIDAIGGGETLMGTSGSRCWPARSTSMAYTRWSTSARDTATCRVTSAARNASSRC